MDEGSGFGKALAIGAGIGFAVVALLLVALVVLRPAGVLDRIGTSSARSTADDVVLVLVLPDEEGVVLPRVIDRYRLEGAAPESISEVVSAHYDPAARVAIPGTSYDMLRDTYPFSGASGLAAAVASATPDVTPAYVVVDFEALEQLTRSSRFAIDVPEHMEVFDGFQLFTLEAGEGEFDAAQIAAMFKGAEYLEDADRESLRNQVGVQLLEALARTESFELVKTDLSAEEFVKWLQALGGLR